MAFLRQYVAPLLVVLVFLVALVAVSAPGSERRSHPDQ